MAALVLLSAIGGGSAFLLGRDNDRAVSTSPPSASPTTTADATVPPTGEFRAVKVGQCMVNDGTDADPRPRLVTCGPDTYEVLKRFDGTTDYETNCGTVPGYQFHFLYDSNLDTLDFVLCLGRR